MKKAIAIIASFAIIAISTVLITKYFHSSRDFITSSGDQTLSSSNYDPTQKLNRLRIEVTTTSDWGHVIVPSGSIILNSTGKVINGAAALGMDSSKVYFWGGVVGAPATYQFEMLVNGNGGLWQIKKGWQNTTHVNVYNINDYNNPILIASEDCTTFPDAKTFDLGGRENIGGPISAGSIGPKKVFATYYPWWPQRSSWVKNPTYGINDLPLTPYGTSDPVDVAGVIADVSAQGIDGFFCSWQGAGIEPSDSGMKALLNAANQRGDFSVAAYLETRVANAKHSYSCLPDQSCQPDPTYIKQWITDLVNKYGSEPSYLKMKKNIDGVVKSVPVIVIYWVGDSTRNATQNGDLTLQQWKQIFDDLHAQGVDAYYIADTIDTSYLQVFDGMHSYNPVRSDDTALDNFYSSRSVLTKTYSLLQDPNAQRKLFMATVCPGSDTTWRGGDIVDRAGGSKYQSMWDISLRYSPDWVMITSWNEFLESTHIEASQQYGDLYEQLTKQYTTQFKHPLSMSITLGDVYWASYADYLDGRLNISYRVNNQSDEDLSSVTITDIHSGGKAQAVTTVPIDIGRIPASSSSVFSTIWRLEPGTTSFNTYIQAHAISSSGIEVQFP